MRLNLNAIQEDLRKVGIAVIIAALAALFFGSANLEHTLYVVFFGLGIWLVGVIEVEKGQEND